LSNPEKIHIIKYLTFVITRFLPFVEFYVLTYLENEDAP
jgi:hypothetical protein